MKRFLLFLFFGGFVCFQSYAQWVVQTSPLVFEARGIHMTSSQVGYIVGSDGIMLKTTNSGQSWFSISTGISDTLRSLFFVNQNTGFIVGAHGTIRKTDDGGLNWTAETSGVTNLLRSVYFVSSSVGYACGGAGVILKTTNGGNDWVQQSSGTTQDLINIRFTDTNNGYAASSLSTFTNGLILKTTNGGTSWSTVYNNTNGLLGLTVINNKVYAGGGYQTIVKSSDGGTSWTQVNAPSTTANHFRSAAYVSPDTAYVVGDLGMIYYTYNGGTSWISEGINTLGVLSIFVVNKDTVFACGASGNILRYTTNCIPLQPAAIIGSSSVCAYDTLTYHVIPVPGTTYYNWHVPPNSNIISGQGDTLIKVVFSIIAGTVTVADSSVCGSSAPIQMAITINLNPPIPTIVQNFNTLISSAQTGNQWYLNGNPIAGAISQNYIFTQNGAYRVKVTTTAGCHAISAIYNVVSAGITDIPTRLSQAVVVPNPVNQTASLNFQLDEMSNVTVTIFEITGKNVLNLEPTRLPAGQHMIAMDCNTLAKGIYLMRLTVNDKPYFIKFLKE
ncbi:MAG: YCF48-related protein [Bacteroidota bacterium]